MRQRLQKLIAEAGLASRRSAEQWIREGRVRVNGAPARLGDSADPEQDDVRLDGRPVRAEPRAYWLLHKPAGVLTTTRDPHAGGPDRRTVIELLPAAARRGRLYPVGRLDRDSEGLLLLTNDGALAQALLHPSLGTEKTYRVAVSGRVEDATARALARGPLLEDGKMAPCRVGPRRYDPERRLTTFELILREGRKRQIRRALRALGHPVRRLVRVRMGPLRLGALAPGESRPLTAAERRALEAHVSRRQAAGAARRPRPRARNARRDSSRSSKDRRSD
jgi:23S rRNA pseudouridine2605 synthase